MEMKIRTAVFFWFRKISFGRGRVDTFSAYRTAKKYYDKKEKPEADDDSKPTKKPKKDKKNKK